MKLKTVVILLLLFFIISCSTNDKKILYIGKAKVDCVGVGPQKCFQVKDENQTEWYLFYDDIEGFDYEEGFYYKIKIKILEVEHPPADGSSLKYELIEILEKSPIPLNLDQGSWLVTQLRNKEHFGRNPFIKIDLSKNDIYGNTGCNRFSGKIEVTQNEVAISEVSATKMACREMDVEEGFLKALQDVSSYALNDAKLQFLDKNGELLIECSYLKSE